MTPLLLTVVAVGGGAGSALRFLIDAAITHWLHTRLPAATALINISGSLALGLLTGLTPHLLSTHWLAILGTGLIGGYTTFSTASIEAVRLLLERRYRDSTIIGLGPLLLSTAAAAGGLLLGQSS